MPSLKDSIDAAKEFKGAQITATPAPASAPVTQSDPGPNPFLRCPLPVLYENNPDALRNFYKGGVVPQSRIMTPLTPVNSGNSTVNESAYIAGGGSGGGSSSSTVNINSSPTDIANNTYTTTLFTQQVVLQTPAVIPGGTYMGQLFMGQSYQLMSVAASSACRIQLYGSLIAQQADAARGLDDPGPAGTLPIITDLVLDTTPLSWAWQNQVGCNAESPQTNITYISVTNLTNATNVITLTIQYVPMSQGNSPNLPTVSVGNTTISNSMLAEWNGVAMLSGAQFTGPIESYNVISGQIDAVNINATGSTTLTDVDVTGNLSTVDLTVTGSTAFTDISANDITAVNITSTGSVTANDFSSSGSITVNEVISNSVNSPIVNVNAGAGGLQVNGTQISSSTLSDAANLPTLSGANVFTAPITAASFTASDSGSVSVFAGEVQSASFTQTSGSSVNNFLGTVNMVDIVSTGGTTLVTINGYLPPTESNADKTLNHVLIQNASVGTMTTFTLAELVSTGVSFSVTAASTSDVFDLSCQMLYSLVSTGGTNANGALLVALVDGVIGSQFGFGVDNVFSSLGPSVCRFEGNTTGLSVGSHIIDVYYSAMILSGSTPGPLAPAGYVTFHSASGSLQQISA